MQTLKKIKIAPSILASDLANLRRGLEVAIEGHADQIHLDVIDGHFAPNITFGPGTVKALRGVSRTMKFDTHLMISQPRLYVDRFIEAGSNLLTFHVEVLDMANFDILYSVAHARGREVGLALKPETDLPPWFESRLERLSTVLVLTVNPGFSGQQMDARVLPKIGKISDMIEERGLHTDLEIDGGIDAENVGEVVRRGGNVIVAGAGVYGKSDPVKEISRIREMAEKSRESGGEGSTC